jgi:type IV secretory pathway VirB10-like protein
MSTEVTLQKFEDKVIGKLAPFEETSVMLRTKAGAVEVSDDDGLRQAVAIKKEISLHAKLIEDSRKAFTRPMDEVKKIFINRESELLQPLNEAKTELSEKILNYEEEVERKRQAEEHRINNILQEFSVDVYRLKTPEEVDETVKTIEASYKALEAADAKITKVELAYQQAISGLRRRKEYLLEEIRQAAERDRLAKEAEKQSAERQEIEAEKAKNAEKERKIAAERQRLEEEKERKRLEEEQEKLDAAEKKAEKSRPKANIATVTEFIINDPDLVPRALCTPDGAKIRQAIKDGITEIDGITITQRKSVR